MTARAWSCPSCGALVQPDEDSCHRCGQLRYAEPEEVPEVGTPAEFVAMVHRTAVGPTPAPRAPLPDTLPAETELAKQQRSNTVPGGPAPPLRVPEVRNLAASPSSGEASSEASREGRSWAWVWWIVIPLILGGGGYAAYWFVEPFQDYVDGMIDAARG